MSSVEARVKKVVEEQLDARPEEVVNSAHFVDDLRADELDIVELMMAFEEKFDIEIPDVEVEKITTVQSAIDFISGALQ